MWQFQFMFIANGQKERVENLILADLRKTDQAGVDKTYTQSSQQPGSSLMHL